MKIYCPIGTATFKELLSGNLHALETDPAAGSIIRIIRAPNVLGDFSLYKGVFEVSVGVEGFTPSAQAKPATGKPGQASMIPTVLITTFVDAAVPEGELSSAIEELCEAHPWEVPVIEVLTTELLLRRV